MQRVTIDDAITFISEKEGNGIEAVKATITPNAAKEMLELSYKGQRPINEGRVAAIAHDIQRGKWKFNGSSFKFDEHGRFVDGHHRAMAIAKSKESVETILIVNLPSSAFEEIDTNRRPRSLTDTLRYKGYKSRPGEIAALLGKLVETHLSDDISVRRGGRLLASQSMKLEMLDKHEKNILKAIQITSHQGLRDLRISAQASLLAFYLLEYGDFDKMTMQNIVDFFQDLAKPERENASQQSYLIRARFDKMVRAEILRKEAVSFQVKMAILIKGWNAFARNEELSLNKLAMKAREVFPNPEFVNMPEAQEYPAGSHGRYITAQGKKHYSGQQE